MNDSRRSFLKTLGASAAGFTLAALETACGSGSSPSASSPSSQGADLQSYYCPILPASKFVTSSANGKLTIQINGAPSHLTGLFPNPNCPGAIVPRDRVFTIDLNPQIAPQPTPLNGWLFGVAVSGVVFDPTGPFYTEATTGPGVWEFEVMSANGRPYLGLDGNCAHTQPSGEYHYHGLPYSLISLLEQKHAGGRMILLGYAADGFPIYSNLIHDNPADPTSPLRSARSSYQLLEGARPAGGPTGVHDGTFVQDYAFTSGLGDLDDCNGCFGVTPEYPNGIYHYHITESFPFVPRFYRGTPDTSFAHVSPGPFPNAVPPALQITDR